MPIPGASVTLYSDAAGETKVGSGDTEVTEAGVFTSIRVARAGTSDNTVHMAVDTDYFEDPTAGMQAVTWNPQSPVHPVPGTADPPAVLNDADIVNLNAEVSVSGATITTEYGGGVELAGWAIEVLMAGADGAMAAVASDTLDDAGMASFASAVAPADLPMSYYFAVAEEQKDSLDGGESIKADTVEHVHNGLSLADTVDVAIGARYATQTLKVYVHHEHDQVEGYTGGVRGADQRVSGMVDVEIRYVSANGRTRAFTKDMWDAAKNTMDTLGVLTFTGVPADMNVIATARAAEDTNIILIGAEQLATYEDFVDNGVTGSAFGDLGGFHHTVELCPLQETAPVGQGHNECGSFAFVSAFTVEGQARKKKVTKESGDGDGFVASSSTGRVVVSNVGVAGTVVTLDPVEGKNIAGESQSFEAAASNDPATVGIDDRKQFDFGRMADGVYEIGIPVGWVAMAGPEELPKEFLLAGHLTSDEDEDGANDHVEIEVTPTAGYLYGHVTGGEGLPAEGVMVDVNGGADVEGGASAVTDESGRYIVEGFSKRRPPRKPVVVTVSGTGYASKTDSTSVVAFAANTPTKRNITLEGIGDVATFSGAVRKSGGGPVSGATIEVSDNTNLLNPNAKSSGATENDIFKTDADGNYILQLQAVAGDVTLTASKKGLSFSPGAGHTISGVANDGISGLDFTAFDHATISGRVLDAGGGPEQYVIIEARQSGAEEDSPPAHADTTSATRAPSRSACRTAPTKSGLLPARVTATHTRSRPPPVRFITSRPARAWHLATSWRR